MPPSLLIDLDRVELNAVCLSREQIYERLPHRYEFMLLDSVCHVDIEAQHIVACSEVRSDDWWVRGHVPGRPLLPGVLMLEMAAQGAALLAKLSGMNAAFIGFGGVESCKFRDAVVPPARLYLLVRGKEIRPRRIVCETQGVIDGKLVFEARITGLTMR